MKITFWLSLFLLFYTHIGYQGILWLWRRFTKELPVPQPVSTYSLPSVSIIVSAYNEGRVIASRIENLLELEYPEEKREIIIASDGSSDDTVKISEGYGLRSVRVLDFSLNRGRAAVHNDAVSQASGDILVFTDSETVFAPDFLVKGVAYLQNESYGCGSGDFSFQPIGAVGQTEDLYWRNEKKIRELEYQLGILSMASGACLIIKKDRWTPIPNSSDIDDYLPPNVLQQGFKVFYAVDAKVCDLTAPTMDSHYSKRVRMALLGMGVTFAKLGPLIKSGNLVNVWSLFSHRILRWLGGYLMFITLIANMGLAFQEGMTYKIFLAGQAAFYMLGLLGWLEDKSKGLKFPWLKGVHHTVHSFILANLGFCHAFMKFLSGEKILSYKPASHV